MKCGRRDRPDRFAKYDHISFPVSKEGADGWVLLFPECFTPERYRNQRAAMTRQMYAAMFECAPVVEGGNRFRTDGVVVHETLDGWPATPDVRGWDLASSSDERDPDDPDWTVGVRGRGVTDLRAVSRGRPLHAVGRGRRRQRRVAPGRGERHPRTGLLRDAVRNATGTG